MQWYTLRVRWSRHEAPTEKKQRFKVLQDALLQERNPQSITCIFCCVRVVVLDAQQASRCIPRLRGQLLL
jgi:plasmid stability protein